MNILTDTTSTGLLRKALDRVKVSERELARRTACNISYLHYSAITGDKPISQRLINDIGRALHMFKAEVLLLKFLVVIEHSKLDEQEKGLMASKIALSFSKK